MAPFAVPKWVSRNELAEALKIHPVTICRAIANDPRARFERAADVKIELAVAAKALGSTPEFLWGCLSGLDYALRLKDIEKLLGSEPEDLAGLIALTALMKPALKYGPKLVRYSGRRTGLYGGKRGRKKAERIAAQIKKEAA